MEGALFNAGEAAVLRECLCLGVVFGLEQCVGESIPHECQDQGLKVLQKTTAFEQDDLCHLYNMAMV